MSSAAEEAYVRSMVEHLDARFESARAEMDRRVTELRDEWSAGVAHQVAASEERIRRIQEENISWLKSRAGADDASVDVAAAGREVDDGPSVREDAASVGHTGPQQRSTRPDPWAAELAEAERIRNMPMDLWAEERQRLVRSGQGMF